VRKKRQRTGAVQNLTDFVDVLGNHFDFRLADLLLGSMKVRPMRKWMLNHPQFAIGLSSPDYKLPTSIF
jgi:hypothetical protein